MLTEAEIDKLEGRALDAAVAEHVMGEPFLTMIDHPPGHVLRGETHGRCWVCVLDYEEGDICRWQPRLFSTDWAAAGLVAEKLGTLHLAHSGATGEWQASYCDAVNSDAHGATAPLAICRAALKAVMLK